MVEKSADILVPGPDESALTRHGKAEPATADTADTADTERELAGILADVVHTDRIHAESHFFNDLGANSLVMAQFCARVRKHPQLPSVSIKDIYRHPTLRELAAALVAAAPAPTAAPAPGPVVRRPGRAPRARGPGRAPAPAGSRAVRNAPDADIPRLFLRHRHGHRPGL